jgi:Pentapeptide repeats (8 copies)
MLSMLRSWWQQIKQHRVAIGVVGIVLVVVIALIIFGYWFDWTGFNGYNKVTIAHTISGTNAGTVTKTEEYQPRKALWDWLQLLIIPLVLAVAALLFNLATTRTEQKIALDKQREDLLQTYLDRMSELLLEKDLRTSPTEAVCNVARVRTITILFQLDARRIGYVFAFLSESGLMTSKPNEESIVSLSEANLEKINFSQANLSRSDLSKAKLIGANLSRANLKWADLSLANLSGADLSGAYFYESDLSYANLSLANLSGADLLADLSNSHLTGTDLAGADLQGANFSEADLSGANLKSATGITIEELEKKAKSLTGAIMPDGSKHR